MTLPKRVPSPPLPSTAAQNRKRSQKSKKKNTPIQKTRQRAQTSDEMPTSSIDQKGNTPLGIAVVRLNCTAVGILANSGARCAWIGSRYCCCL